MNTEAGKKRFSLLVSYDFFFALIFSTAALSLVVIYLYKLTPREVMEFAPTQVLLLMLVLNRFFGMFFEVFTGRKTLVVTIGFIVLLCGLVLNSVFWYEGTVTLGEGEKFSGFDRFRGGRLARPPRTLLTVGTIEGNPLERHEDETTVELLNEMSGPVILSGGQSRRWQYGMHVRLVQTGAAPLLVIRESNGEELHAGYMKLGHGDQKTKEYLIFPDLPHRFYVNVTEDKEKPFHFSALRGKLTVIDKDVSTDEPIEFDRFVVSFPELANSATIQVDYYPGTGIIYAGALILSAGFIVMAWLSRRRS